MCGGSESSASTSTSATDNRVTADNSGIALGGGATLNNVGLKDQDLSNVLKFLQDFGQGASDFGTKALDTISMAQLNQKDPGAASAVNIAQSVAWPLAVSVAAGLILMYLTKKKG